MSEKRRYERTLRLERFGFASYGDYLRSPRWQDTRRRYWASELPKDCMCGETEALQLHHLTYERVAEEQLGDLTPLCKRCHKMIHILERRGEIGLDFTGFVCEQRAQRYAAEANPGEAGTDWEAVRRERIKLAKRLAEATGSNRYFRYIRSHRPLEFVLR